MEKVTIMKVCVNNSAYKVNRLCDEAGKVAGFRVMRGRNVAKGGAWFAVERAAVEFAIRRAVCELFNVSEEGIS